MKRLSEFKTSPVNVISIKYNDEHFKFNLYDELRITEMKLEAELKNQPSKYGFLLLLHKKLRTRFHELKQERAQLKAKLFFEAKENGYPDRKAEAYVQMNKEFKLLTKRCIRAKDHEDAIYACVAAFEQRKDLLQTISSNRRKES